MLTSSPSQDDCPIPATGGAILVAAGRARRMGGRAKILHPLNGRPAISYALDAMQAAQSIGQIVVVCNDETHTSLHSLLVAGEWAKVGALVPGGERRQDSVAAGLAAISERCDVVAVHDGARPFAPPALFDACIDAARRHGAAIAALPVVDTLKQVDEGVVHATVDRTGLWAAQTPQAFQTRLLRDAFAHADQHGIEATDEATLMETIGQAVHVVEGSRFNIKITHAGDVPIAEAFARFLREQP